MRPFIDIGDYAVIGDCRTAALVSPDGSIDWLCLPRFDSPSVFARLLDPDVGGSWQVRPTDPASRGDARYRRDSPIVDTDWPGAHGSVTVTDCLLYAGEADHAGSSLLRIVECTAGIANVRSEFRPRPEYGLKRTRTSSGPADGCDGEYRLSLGEVEAAFNVVHLAGSADVRAQREPDGDLIHELRLRAGDRIALVLTTGDEQHTRDAVVEAFDHCREFWHRFAESCRYEGEYRELVVRSAITLKLLSHIDTGAIVAAPTTSLPEELGGVRNWDYRYTWLRDASMTVHSLLALHLHDEALPFAWWTCQRVCDVADVGELRIMYTLDGSSRLPERELSHLRGYEDSRPVRVGNAAVDQRQLDVYGEVLDMAAQLLAHPEDWPGFSPASFEQGLWPYLSRLPDWVAGHWHEADSGIWEVRAKPRHYTHSKVMSWVALDRAVRIAEAHDLPGDVGRWRHQRELVHADVLEHGYDHERGAFVQSYGSTELDASTLLIPLVNFLPASDPRVQRTMDAVMADLMQDGLVYRYRTETDGIRGGEASFGICTFWLISALAMSGRQAEAGELFRRIVDRCGPLGLFAEEIDPTTGRMLGNYPQAFTHIGLVNAALSLVEAGETAAEAAELEELRSACSFSFGARNA